MKRHFAIAMALLLVPAIGSAQRLSPEFARLAEPWSEASVTRAATAVFGHPDDYRWEGLVLGGVVVGVLGAAVASGFCGDPDAGSGSQNCVVQGFLGFLVGATAGGVVGGMIGTIFKKEKPAP